MKRVIGLDLSLTATGVSTGRKAMAIKRPSGQTAWPELKRLRWMRDKVMFNVIDFPSALPPRRNPHLVVIEGLAFSRTTGHATTRAGLWWLTVEALDCAGIPYAVVPPTTRAKYACGKGNAGKDAVLSAAVRRFPDVEFDDNNAADALWLAAMGYDHLGEPLTPMPALNRASLDAVKWPDLLEDPGRGAA